MSDTNKWRPCPRCGGAGVAGKDWANGTPCFTCDGVGQEGDWHRCVKNVQVESVDGIVLNPDTFCPIQNVTVKFGIQYEAQQDGHRPKQEWLDAVRAIQIGKAVLAALKEKGLLTGW